MSITNVIIFRKTLKKAKEDHDEEFMAFDLGAFNRQITPRLNEFPYKPNSRTREQENIRESRQAHMSALWDNIFVDGNSWDGNDLMARMQFFLRRKTQKLCKGTFQKPPGLDKKLKCILLDHKNPYLKLGPFKYEVLHEAPEIGLFKELASENEIMKVRHGARGKMKSTPYAVGDNEAEFSKGRTSKVMYMNERLVPEVMVLSKKIQLATRFSLYHERFASENYQIMNYGIGGKISGHADSQGETKDTTTVENGKISREITLQ